MADRWENFNLGNVMPGFVPAVINPAVGAAQGIGSILQVSATLMSTLQTFIVDVTDPAAAVANSVIAQIEKELATFVNTGIYFTHVVPKNLADRKGTKTNLRTIVNSMRDVRDPNRPQYTALESCGAIILMAGGADLTRVLPTAGLLDLLFNINEIKGFLKMNNPNYIPEAVPFPSAGGFVTGLVDGKDPRRFFTDLSRAERVDHFARLRFQFTTGPNKGVTTRVKGFDPLTRTFELVRCPRNIEVGNIYQILYPQGGRPPDWISLRAIDLVPPLSDILIAMQSLTRLLAAGVATTKAAGAFVGALQKKAKQLIKTTEYISARIREMQVLLEASGLSILRLSSEPGGVDNLATRMLAADDAPEFQDGKDFTISAILVGNASSYQVVRRLF